MDVAAVVTGCDVVSLRDEDDAPRDAFVCFSSHASVSTWDDGEAEEEGDPGGVFEAEEGVLSAIPNPFLCEDTPCEVVLFAKGVCLPSAVVICFLSPRPRGEPRGSNASNFLFVCASTDPVAPVAPVASFNAEAVDEAPAASLNESLLLLPSSSNPISAHVVDESLC